MFFQKDIETMPRQKLEELQLERLKHIVAYCYDNVPFYHKRLSEAGVTPDKIKSLSDVQYIPFTTKEDIRDNYPFGLFAVPMKDIVRIHASSGTTGKPTVVGYTRRTSGNLGGLCGTAVRCRRERPTRTSSRSPLATACLPARWGCTTAWKKWARR